MLATVKGDVHDIGKNLVDIILTNNGYEVFNLGIKVPIADMVAKAKEVEADAIGMSGLLVKSTLIMRDNLEELNALGLAEVPVLLGGAALTRTYVERDLREVYEGRLFYGRDAFEGLHTMDRLMDLKRVGRRRPRLRPVPTGRVLPERVASGRERRGRRRCRRGRPTVATDNPVFVPPFLGSRVVKGISLDDIAEYVNETALFRNQWQFRPEAGENDDEFKARIRPAAARAAGRGQGVSGVLVPQVVYGYFPANGDGNDLVVWTDEARTAEQIRFRFPRQKVEPFLCIADFFRPVDVAASPTTPPSTSSPWAAPSRRPRPSCSPRTATRSTCCCTASAWRWPRRWPSLAPAHPRGVGLRRRGRPDARRAVPPAVPRRALLVGLPGVPRPRGQRHGGRAARGRAPRHRGERGDRLAVPARADHVGHHLPPPPGQVLRRSLTGPARPLASLVRPE